MIALESLIKSDVISSKQIFLVYAFPNYSIYDQLGNHRCHSDPDFGKGLFQGFHSLSSGKAFHVSEPGWCRWQFWGPRQDQGGE